MSDPAFEERSANFLHWFKALPGASFHADIEIRDLRQNHRGRGISKFLAFHPQHASKFHLRGFPFFSSFVSFLSFPFFLFFFFPALTSSPVAKNHIPEDTVLFTIPRTAIISTQTSDLAKRIPDVFTTTVLDDADGEADDDDGATTGPPDNWVSLILVMIYEYLQGDRSRWQRYFNVLPTEFDTLMWWSDKELDWLQASSIVAKIGKDDADSMFRARILPIIEKNSTVFYPEGSPKLSEEQLILLAHRIGSTIMAYAFDLENDDEADQEEEDGWVEDREGKVLMGMVPMADILNADAEFNVGFLYPIGIASYR